VEPGPVGRGEVAEIGQAEAGRQVGASQHRKAADPVDRVDDRVGQGVGEQVQVARLLLGMPGRRPGRRRLRLAVEEDRQQVGGRDPVDHAVVNLRDERPASVVEALDHPELPERAGAVEVGGEHPAGQVAQLLRASRLGDRGVADVVEDLEVGVVDPHRPPELERYEADPLPVARHQREVGGDGADQVTVGGRRALEHRDVPDMHRVVGVLDVQEHRVLRAHSVQISTSIPHPFGG